MWVGVGGWGLRNKGGGGRRRGRARSKGFRRRRRTRARTRACMRRKGLGWGETCLPGKGGRGPGPASTPGVCPPGPGKTPGWQPSRGTQARVGYPRRVDTSPGLPQTQHPATPPKPEPDERRSMHTCTGPEGSPRPCAAPASPARDRPSTPAHPAPAGPAPWPRPAHPLADGASALISGEDALAGGHDGLGRGLQLLGIGVVPSVSQDLGHGCSWVASGYRAGISKIKGCTKYLVEARGPVRLLFRVWLLVRGCKGLARPCLGHTCAAPSDHVDGGPRMGQSCS